MRRFVPVLLIAALGGCQDVIGLGGSCAGEMQSVRRAEGSPDHTQQTREGGDFVERWIYQSTPGASGFVYTFRWGTSYESCEMSGPAPLDLVPSDDARLSASPDRSLRFSVEPGRQHGA